MAAGIAAAAAGAAHWHGAWSGGAIGRTVLMMALAAAAGSFPMRLSPQAHASLVGAPIFAAVLVLAPAQAVLVAVAALLAPDLRLRRRPEVALFNLGMAVLATALAANVFRSVGGTGAGVASLSATHLGYAAAAGAVLHVTNTVVVAGIVWLKKGSGFWAAWKRTWLLDAVQEAGVLALGYVAAALLVETPWAVLLLVPPMALAHIALSRSVSEAARNIDLAKKLEQQMVELRTAQAQLVQREKLASIGTLAAGVAHEINTPLFCINGAAELLLEEKQRHLASGQSVEYVTVIHEMAERAARIVSDLLGYSRPSTERERVKLTDVMDAAVNLVGKQLTQKGIEVRREYQEAPPVLAVPSHAQQVFVNLLLNARDATEAGGIVTLRCDTAANGHARAVVQDNGAGIPEKVRGRLFEPFVTSKDVGQGTGLGLFICHRIVTEHGGRIGIESKEGKGTMVVVELPPAGEAETAKLRQTDGASAALHQGEIEDSRTAGAAESRARA